MPKVLNKRFHDCSNAVYIGRPGIHGNPFWIGADGDRAEVIAKHEKWVRENPDYIKKVKEQLRGKDLACWCAPLPCHGDTLLRIANEDDN